MCVTRGESPESGGRHVINLSLKLPFCKMGVMPACRGTVKMRGWVCVSPGPQGGTAGTCPDGPFCPPQEAEIDSIHQLVVGATENIKEGNEDIREVGDPGPQPAFLPLPTGRLSPLPSNDPVGEGALHRGPTSRQSGLVWGPCLLGTRFPGELGRTTKARLTQGDLHCVSSRGL